MEPLCSWETILGEESLPARHLPLVPWPPPPELREVMWNQPQQQKEMLREPREIRDGITEEVTWAGVLQGRIRERKEFLFFFSFCFPFYRCT